MCVLSHSATAGQNLDRERRNIMLRGILEHKAAADLFLDLFNKASGKDPLQYFNLSVELRRLERGLELDPSLLDARRTVLPIEAEAFAAVRDFCQTMCQYYKTRQVQLEAAFEKIYGPGLEEIFRGDL